MDTLSQKFAILQARGSTSHQLRAKLDPQVLGFNIDSNFLYQTPQLY